MELLKIGFLGAGRVAAGLGLALARAGLHVAFVASRQADSAVNLAGQFRAATAGDAQELVRCCELVFVTTPDDRISAAVAGLPWRPGQRVVHCSGASSLASLDAAAAKGALTGGFHPLQIFSDGAAAADRLCGSSVAIESADAGLRTELTQLAERLGMHPLQLPEGGRALYHAGAGYAASFVLLMLGEASRIWAQLGIAPEEALRALLPLARGSLEAAAQRGVANALSGPLVRGDSEVVKSHLQALHAWSDDHEQRYRALARLQLASLLEAGRLAPADAATLQRVLDTPV